MLIVSDTNILSSFSAGSAIELLLQLFPEKSIHIPPAVERELLQGITRGQDHLKTISQAISEGKIQLRRAGGDCLDKNSQCSTVV